MSNITTINGLKEIIDNYDIFILDQWGVLHDGKRGYKHSIKCVDNLFQNNKKLIIISNSSRRKENTVKRLPKLGFNSKYFLEIMTSGEMIWQSLYKKNHNFIKKIKKNCYFIYDQSKNDSKDFIKGLERYNFVKKIEDADFILACSTTPGLNTIDYVPILIQAIEKDLPFVCANPDYETVENSSNNLIICMGAIAELYTKLGGKTFSLGKPTTDIYDKATKKIQKLNKRRVLAIGDSIFHDIQGANLFGIDSLLITSGIHHLSFHKSKPNWYSKINCLKYHSILPKFICSKFNL